MHNHQATKDTKAHQEVLGLPGFPLVSLGVLGVLVVKDFSYV
jgi:hypothetical protein